MATMAITGWRDQWVRWSIQAGEIDGYDGQYRLKRLMGTMVNTGWRDRRLRWSTQFGDIDGYDGQYRLERSMVRWSIKAGSIDGYDGQYRLERSMDTMVNTGWRDRWLRWSIQAG